MRIETISKTKRGWLWDARKRKNMTAQDVAEAVGISRSHYSMIENNMREPSVKVAVNIALLLEIDVAKFIEGKMSQFETATT